MDAGLGLCLWYLIHQDMNKSDNESDAVVRKSCQHSKLIIMQNYLVKL